MKGSSLPWPKAKKRGWLGVIAWMCVLLTGVVVIYAFFVLRHDPTLTNLDNRLQGISLQHPLGTDQLGRDVLTRLLLGGQQTIGYSLLALIVSLVIGIPFGLISGFRRGLVDRIFMRIADGFLDRKRPTAVPKLYCLSTRPTRYT